MPLTTASNRDGPEEVMTMFRATVKNTFIDIEVGEMSNTMRAEAQPRCSSVPPSVRLCRDVKHEELASVCVGKLILPAPMPLSFHQSDASTDAHTEHSPTCSECGLSDSSPASQPWEPQEALVVLDNYYPCGPSATLCGPPGVWMQSVTPLSSPAPRARLNAKASAYQPVQLQKEPEDPAKENYKLCLGEVVSQALQALSDCSEVASAELHENAEGWTLTIKPRGGDEWQTDSLMTFAKEVLLEVAANSRNIYVMGYCAPKPFTMRAQGFQATLGAMANAKDACWHYYKKGFCRHAESCRSQHPEVMVPLQVLVESAHFDSYPDTVTDFKDEVAELAMTVTATLKECAHAFHVETYKPADGQGWIVEVTPREESKEHREYLLTVAKSTLFSDSNASNSVYIMGYAVQPFTSKSDGFVTMVGNMRDPTKACWDLYSKGMCTRDCLCKWQHPTCYMPVDVVIKPMKRSLAR